MCMATRIRQEIYICQNTYQFGNMYTSYKFHDQKGIKPIAAFLMKLLVSNEFPTCVLN